MPLDFSARRATLIAVANIVSGIAIILVVTFYAPLRAMVTDWLSGPGITFETAAIVAAVVIVIGNTLWALMMRAKYKSAAHRAV